MTQRSERSQALQTRIHRDFLSSSGSYDIGNRCPDGKSPGPRDEIEGYALAVRTLFTSPILCS